MNAAARRLGIELPIVQAPVGSVTTPELAAAVSNAGGLGMLAGSWRSPDELRVAIRATRALTSRPFGVNFVLAFDPEERLAAALDAGVRIISFFWGDPGRWASMVHEAGGLVMYSAGSVGEGVHAAGAGADILVAQGVEAGGHVRGTTPRGELVEGLRAALPGVPLLAAGGIADAAEVCRAREEGADGVWIGTRFVASAESGAHPAYQARILAASASDTVLGTTFDVGWPDAPHRAIRNRTTDAAARGPDGSRPGEGDIIAHHADGRPVVRYEDTIPLAGMTGDVELLALYAGTSVAAIDQVLPAATIVQHLSTALRA